MLAELLVPIFLPGIAFLAILLVLKPEHRGRWSGLFGGCVLPLWPPSWALVTRAAGHHHFELAPIAIDLGQGGFAFDRLLLLAFKGSTMVRSLGLGAFAGALGRSRIWTVLASVCWGLSVVASVKWWMLASEATLGRLVGLGAWVSCVALAPMALDGGFTTLMILSASGATIAGALVLAPQALVAGGGGAMLLGAMVPLLAWCGFSYDYAEAPWWQWAGVAGLPVAIIVFFDPHPAPEGQARRPWLSGLLRAVLVVLLVGWLLQPTLDSLLAPADDPYGSY